MRYFTFLVTDARYSVPSLIMRPARADLDAIGFARRQLLTSPYYLAMEIWEGERFVGVERLEKRSDPPAESRVVVVANDVGAPTALEAAPGSR